MPAVEVTGNQPSFTAKPSWASEPITNTGMEMTMRVVTSTRLSRKPPLRTPARTPAAMPMINSNRIAMMVSLIVVG